MNDYGAFYLIEFEDGSAEGQILHRGPRDECDRTAETIPAVSYSGPKRAKQARVVVMPWMDVEAMFSPPPTGDSSE